MMIKRSVAFVAVALCAALMVQSAAFAAGPAKSDDKCSLNPADIFERYSHAVVFISSIMLKPFQPESRIEHSEGSGFIFDKDGLILTNAHVVFGASSMKVTLDDGTQLLAGLVGIDPVFDLAVIKIAPPKGVELPVLELADSNRLRIGDPVVAIGNPLGLEQTLTSGVISGRNRILPEAPLAGTRPMIQTDAPINPGNSGGPLMTACGEVAGITSEIIPDAQSIGFAVPSNLIRAALPSLLKYGRMIRPWIGFHGQVITRELSERIRLPHDEGMIVEVVEPESPASKAGLRGGDLDVAIGGQEVIVGGDIVVAINGVSLKPGDDDLHIEESLKVGDTLRLTLFRDGKLVDIAYKLVERPTLPGDVER